MGQRLIEVAKTLAIFLILMIVCVFIIIFPIWIIVWIVTGWNFYHIDSHDWWVEIKFINNITPDWAFIPY